MHCRELSCYKDSIWGLSRFLIMGASHVNTESLIESWNSDKGYFPE